MNVDISRPVGPEPASGWQVAAAPHDDAAIGVAERVFVAWALEAVQGGLLARELRRFQCGTGLPYSGAMLLTLLSYCYARGLYSSREIEAACRTDDTLRYLCANQLPDWNTLRRFRRRAIRPLQETLAALLRRAFTEAPGCTASTMPRMDFELDAFHTRRWLWGPSQHAERLAVDRIQQSVRADAYALDE